MARRKRRVDRPIPAHPYRDTALVYGVMAVLLIVVASLTGGDKLRGLLVAAVFFLVATTWSWWKFRGRIKERDAAKTPQPPDGSGGGQANGNGRGSTKR
jgi:membrane protein implicated in regulation of membrane protease activity